MAGSVQVVVLDVNETLSDMEPLRARFTAHGVPASMLDTWFAATLRDGFALAAAGAAASFPVVGAGAARALLSGLAGLTAPVEDVVTDVLDGFRTLGLHPDVADGLRTLHHAGVRLVTLTNGSAALAAALFDAAGVADLVERRLTVDDAGRWKPHPRAYAYAGEQCGTPPASMCMVAVHPWDTDGAGRAGLRTAWLDRSGTPFPKAFLAPDVTARDLPTLAARILEL